MFAEERRFVGTGFRYEDLVAAVDVVVTKPGYGIIAECIAAGTAMLYTSRGDFREYDLLVREMPRYLRCRFISQDDLFAGRWRDALEALVAQPRRRRRSTTDGAEVAARTIVADLRLGCARSLVQVSDERRREVLRRRAGAAARRPCRSLMLAPERPRPAAARTRAAYWNVVNVPPGRSVRCDRVENLPRHRRAAGSRTAGPR